jgi:hypothetical protein
MNALVLARLRRRFTRLDHTRRPTPGPQLQHRVPDVGVAIARRSAQLILSLLYLDRRGRPNTDPQQTKVGPKRRFLLSAVASMSTRHPRKQGASAGHRAEGLRQAGKCLLPPRPQFTAHHPRLVTRWFVLRTALLFVRAPCDSPPCQAVPSVRERRPETAPHRRRVSLFCFFPRYKGPRRHGRYDPAEYPTLLPPTVVYEVDA